MCAPAQNATERADTQVRPYEFSKDDEVRSDKYDFISFFISKLRSILHYM